MFNTLVYQPLYNLLVYLIGVLPSYDVGLAVIASTLIIKALFLPLSIKAARTQFLLKELEPEVNALKEKHKNDRPAQARALMELYRGKRVSPFTMFLVLLIQIPVIIALYLIFFKGGLPSIRLEELYAFVSPPAEVNMLFLGFLDMAAKSWPLAVLAGATQFLQAQISTPPSKPASEKPTLGEDFARSMNIQIRYVLPVVIVFVAHSLSSAVALYWVASNAFSIIQDWWIKKTITRESKV